MDPVTIISSSSSSVLAGGGAASCADAGDMKNADASSAGIAEEQNDAAIDDLVIVRPCSLQAARGTVRNAPSQPAIPPFVEPLLRRDFRFGSMIAELDETQSSLAVRENFQHVDFQQYL
jgi:hypothetical protein